MMRPTLFLLFSFVILFSLKAQDKIVTSLYKDPQGRFTITAPKTWKLMPDLPIYRKRLWLYKMLPDSGNYAMIKVTAGYSSNTKPFSMDSMLKIMKKMGVDVKESGTEKLGPYKAYWVMGKDFQDVWQYMYYLFAGKN
ncbi:MAG: hypothetical protein K0S32_4444, partial [Bacteroidetes bacterium]|nr:hypothetical protein [Bacteroidota bacterium]